jgi:hypothetical protein
MWQHAINKAGSLSGGINAGYEVVYVYYGSYPLSQRFKYRLQAGGLVAMQ